MERRAFLKYTTWFSTTLWADVAFFGTFKSGPLFRNPNRILVVIELAGGCDGLNTVIPFRNSVYYSARPNLAISPQDILKITDNLGFHPSLAGFKEIYDNGHMAVVQGVGYPNPNRCHLRSMNIWQTAKVKESETSGWLAKYLGCQQNSGSLRGTSIGCELPRAMASQTEFLISKNRIVASEILNKNLEKHYKYRRGVDYPNTSFASNLQSIAQIIAADCGVNVFYTSLPGFDTHANQVVLGNNLMGVHANLLAILSTGIKAFFDDMKNMGKGREVLIMTFSEFGRRINENARAGTDHGTANLMILVGGKVNPGFYGKHPELEDSQLDEVGDMIYEIDFRSVYSTVLARWLNADPVTILGESWPLLSFL
jgi:uncharacterized protein (DUF1501 family)